MNDPSCRFQRLAAHEVPAWLAAHPDALLLDARESQDHARGHLGGSLRLDGRNHEPLLLQQPKRRPVFIYCYHGNASRSYAQMFVDFGFRAVFDLVGGWEAWQKQHGTPAAGPTHDAHGNTPHLLTQDDYSALDMAASVECLQLLRGATRSAA